MFLGVLAGLAAGALWGLTFVAPLAVAPFTIIDLTVARYGVFGLTSAALMLADARFRIPLRTLTTKRMLIGLVLGVLGYVAYFVAAAYAAKLAGPAIPPLVIGFLPVLLAVFGNWSDGSLPWDRLAIPLAFIMMGTLAVDLKTLADSPDALSTDSVVVGTLCAVTALCIWVLYAVLNSRVMRSPAAPRPLAWTGLQGIGAGLGALPLIPLSSFWSGALPSPLFDVAGLNFVGWALLLGIPGAWAATWFWVIAARRLSLALSAQLVVTESVFGLAYGFLYLGRLPTLIEGIGSALQILGVVMAVRLFSGLSTPETAIEPATADEVAVTGSPR